MAVNILFFRIVAPLVAVTASLLVVPVGAASVSGSLPAIAIIIDDMGNRLEYGKAALSLPGPLTYAFLPYTPYAGDLARQAHRMGKEVMLHLPLQSQESKRLGPGGLGLHMDRDEFQQTFRADFDAIPHAAGVNNHMGSLLTRHPGAMEWLMQEIRGYEKIYFIDSRTTKHTVAEQVAVENSIPSSRRDVFLDNPREPEAIRRQLHQLLRLARERGHAIGIGHPYPETVAVLKEELGRLQEQGVRLVPVSQLVHLQGREEPGQEESSSPSPRIAKNLKASP